MRDRYDSLFQCYAAPQGLDWRLLKAQMLAESAGNPDAVSPAGAMGLAQFLNTTWREWWDGTPGIQDAPPISLNPYNPEAAIRAQAAYLAWLCRQFGGDLVKALAAYNWGIGRVRRCLTTHGSAWRDMLPQETRTYLARIGRLYGSLGGPAI